MQIGAYSPYSLAPQQALSAAVERVARRPEAGRGDSATAVTVKRGELTPDEARTVARLRETDRAVRQHEQAHLAAGAGLVTGGPSYSYTTGPDGKRYAVGGEVSIDVSPARSPEATIAKARQIRAAALAPADPSGKDRQVAVAAGRLEAEARAELAAQDGGSRPAVAGYAGIGDVVAKGALVDAIA
ncbi:MAG TPA: putative metalloprotease CJM1_0395 family protein [Azospira sp.]|nr:putative metalloprotease CJM1_0395 family protein [Azospira sp.]